MNYISCCKKRGGVRLLFFVITLLRIQCAYAQIELSVEGLCNPVFGKRGWLIPAGHEGTTNSISIPFGDPLGFKIILENQANIETKPFIVNLSDLIPGHMILTHPDGTRFSINLRDGRRTTLIRSRPMAAHERVERDFILYNRAPQNYNYIFPQPGKYALHVVYFTEFPDKGLRWDIGEDGEIKMSLDELRTYNGIIVSNPLIINVGPPFPGWEELAAAGLVETLAKRLSFEELLNRLGKEHLDTLVKTANRPWLLQWYAEQI